MSEMRPPIGPSEDGVRASVHDPTEAWDALVVGSGAAGLTVAACLAGAGKKVLVLEAHDVAGGNLQVFRRHHGEEYYEFDVGVHYIGEASEGQLFKNIYSGLGLGKRIEFARLDDDGFDTLLFPDFELRVPASWDLYKQRLIDVFPAERAGISRCIETLQTVFEQSRFIFGEPREVYDLWADRTLDELFGECELSQRAMAALDYWAGLYAGAPSQTAVRVHAGIIGHYMSGAFYPKSGGQMMAARLVQAIEANGGEVRTLSAVRQILTRGGAVRGVELESGEIIDAPLVVSNADYKHTVLRLLDPAVVPPAVIEWAESARMTLGLVCLYVVVAADLEGPNTNYFVFPDYRTEELYSELDAGELPETQIPFAYIAMASRKDPGNVELCPPGYTNFQVMTLAPRGYSFWGVDAGPNDGEPYRRNPKYREAKDQLTRALLESAKRVLGDFEGQMVHCELATPLTHERYVSSSGGTSYGLMHSPDQIGQNRPQYRTEIEGLWVVGANTVGGHGVAGAMSGGVFCASAILDRPLIVEFFMGQQLIDDDRIPPDPEPFDPLEFSRGARLRNRRAQRTESAQLRRMAAQRPDHD